MDKAYIALLSELARATELTAEQAMELNKKNGDLKGYGTAKTMRDNYSELYDRMRAKDFDSTTLTKNDYCQLTIGAIIMIEHLEKKIAAEQKVLQGYKQNALPKLDRIINCETEEEATKLAEELFQLKENN